MGVSNYNACGLDKGSLRRRTDRAEIVDVGEDVRWGNGQVGWENVLKYFHVFILLGKSTGYCTVGDSGCSGDVGN